MKILVTAKRVPDPEQKVKLKGGAHRSHRGELRRESVRRVRRRGGAAPDREGGRRRASGSARWWCSPSGPTRRRSSSAAAWPWAPTAASTSTASDDTLDSEQVARLVAAVVDKEKPDLVLMGKQAVDGDANQVAQLVAGYLGWPQACFAAHHRARRGRQVAASSAARSTAAWRASRSRCPAWSRVDLRIVRPRRSRTTSPPRATSTPRARATPRSRGSWRPRRSRSRPSTPRRWASRSPR